MSAAPAGPTAADPHAVFRPRRGRLVALVLAVASVLVFGVLALILPGGDVPESWGTPDRLLIAAFGVAIAAFLLRYARIRAVPSPQGLVVHNLMGTRRLVWAQIVRIQFATGAPWVTLELDDTDTVAVMAIQRADGPTARAQASRLSALIQAYGAERDG